MAVKSFIALASDRLAAYEYAYLVSFDFTLYFVDLGSFELQLFRIKSLRLSNEMY